ncbi:malto-oligosyltrehalose trehalohydrolase [Halomonas sp. M20]|uniref:malto-oligosyltrehalose trehalohydrolase n=1 Tax=Halomonas sp. M20 TaxID=2763264 RepID=UPI001D0A70B7|nr:malto-oligosyltrehalose trehalohydrolase [Halomonas sp. M20]
MSMDETPAASFRFDPRFGAQLQTDGRTRFTLWAPTAEQVWLEIEGGDSQSMQPMQDGHHQLIVQCAAGARYRYRVFSDEHAQGLAIPDPASRAQLDDIDGPSLVIDPDRYTWQHPQWQGRPWHESVIYELHVGTLGGFEGVRQRLAYLASLGITAIELMPVAEFPGGRNWGYDGVLPYAVEASYGDPDDLKALIDEAHGHGLMVYLDVVYNHFGPDGNYLAAYAGTFFREDLPTPWGAAIDFRQPQVRRYFIDNALMWLLEYRFDGLRFDAVHAIGEQDFLTEMAREIRARVEPGRHVHLMLENESNQASLLDPTLFDAQWNDDWHNVMHVLLTGEYEGYYSDFTEGATERLARCLGEGFIYQGETTRGGHARGESSAHLPPSAFVIFLQNHDQIGNRALGERLGLLTEPQALVAATVPLLLSPMIPLLFMGEEWGSTQPFCFFTSHHGELAEAVRKGRRNEFAAFSAFSDAATREAIPDPNDRQTFVDSIPDFDYRETPSHAMWLTRYRKLLALRQREIVPRLPGAVAETVEVLAEKAWLARWRLNDRSQLVIALNLRDDRVTVTGLSGITGLLYETQEGTAASAEEGWLERYSAVAWLHTDTQG